MAPVTRSEFAVVRSERTPWKKFSEENDWAEAALQNAPRPGEPIPESCNLIYYVVDKAEKKIVDKLYVVTWLPIAQHQKAFRDLNWAWVERLFKIEKSDIHQLEHPQETIINPGGEIIFLQREQDIIGTVAVVFEHDEYELSKMSVSDQHQGRGYSHLLMYASLDWARARNVPEITILSNQVLVNALTLYKQHGFETVRLGPHPNYERCDIVMKWRSDKQ
ncbi:acyl-CoA N-acyltransferase [Umbelopsis sp. PMI_123]|nr:acyl-CoA N-acyltransferase [Umbelopsis sp. PMI_123]